MRGRDANRNAQPRHPSLSSTNATLLSGSSLLCRPTASTHQSKLSGERHGTNLFFGDWSNISFLQQVRDLVRTSIGSCPFVDDPLPYDIWEDDGNQRVDWLHASSCPGVPSLESALLLVRQFRWATSCVLDLVDESTLIEKLPRWIRASGEIDVGLNSIYYLVFAIGAQASSESDEKLERRYFNYGRYLAAYNSTHPLTSTDVQCHLLITWYLLGAGQVTSAYVQLGAAARAASLLGLHEDAAVSSHDELKIRLKLWKSIRILDGFLNLILGRPSSLPVRKWESETSGAYSACLDLCVIFEDIVHDVHTSRLSSKETLENIKARHHRWLTNFRDGLESDGVKLTDRLQYDGVELPNIDLYHLKEAFYRSITILTLPFLMKFTASHTSTSMDRITNEELPPSSENHAMYACVGSAISIMEMFQKLVVSSTLPKRLPYLVNALFTSALTIGLASFGDLDYYFPLERHLCTAEQLLHRLAVHDPIAERELTVVRKLHSACNAYLDKRNSIRMEQRSFHYKSLLGDADWDRPVPVTQRGHAIGSHLSHVEQLSYSESPSYDQTSANDTIRDASFELFTPSSHRPPPNLERYEVMDDIGATAFDFGVDPYSVFNLTA
jgi:hypothetical protein